MDVETTIAIRKSWESELERYQARSPLQGFPPLPAIPAGRYVSPDFQDLENRYLWRRTWLLAGIASQIPAPGDYFVWRDAGVPVLIVRSKDASIRAFFNTCRHRGSSLVKAETGKLSAFVCPYHHWTYDLEGRLAFVPWEHEFPGLDMSSHSLRGVRCESWGNLIFVNFDADARPLMDSLAPLPGELDHMDMDKVRLITRTSLDVPCNWKVLMDANLELYHYEAVHPETVSKMYDNRQQNIALFNNGHSRLIPKKLEASKGDLHILDRGRSGEDPRHQITRDGAMTYTLFPNAMLSPAEFQWFIFVYWPTSLTSSRLDTYYLAPPGHDDPEAPAFQQIRGALEYVAQEDIRNLASVQRSMESTAFDAITLGTLERRIYHYQEEIDRRIGIENIPVDMRIEPVLKPFEE